MVKYPNNDLWSVRQIEFLYDALRGYENKSCHYYVNKTVTTVIEDIATYHYVGVIVFAGQDRTIMLKQGDGYGLTPPEVMRVFAEKILLLFSTKNETWHTRQVRQPITSNTPWRGWQLVLHCCDDL